MRKGADTNGKGKKMRIINGLSVTAATLFLAAGTAQAATTTYPAIQSTIKYNKTSTSASFYSNFARATSRVLYDPATQTYTLRDTGSLTTTSSFGPGNINAAASNSTFTVYNKGPGETLRLLTHNPANPLIVLSYVTYGQWRRTTTSGGTTSVNDTYVVFGNKSPSTAVTSGTGNYSTVIDGTFINKNGSYAVSGTGTFNADFLTHHFTYSSTASGAREGGGTGINFGTMTGSGSIATRSAGFTGTGTYNGNGYAMDVAGNFYGPAAQELGGVFQLRGNLGNGTGAIVGHK